jgi:hypothetical protein
MLASGKVASTAGASDTACRAGVDSSAGSTVFSLATAMAGSSSSQVKSVDFLQSTQAGCQPSMTTKSNVLLGKDHHLQGRPDYCHGWGAEDAGNVDQSSLGRRLFLRLCSRCLLSDSSGRRSILLSDGSGRRSTPLSNRGLARQLLQELLHGGGWATTTPSWLPHCVLIAFVTLLNGVGRRQGNLVVNTQHRDISTRLPYSRRLTSWDVVSVTFNFLATHLRATLRGLLGGAGRLASRLVGGS